MKKIKTVEPIEEKIEIVEPTELKETLDVTLPVAPKTSGRYYFDNQERIIKLELTRREVSFLLNETFSSWERLRYELLVADNEGLKTNYRLKSLGSLVDKLEEVDLYCKGTEAHCNGWISPDGHMYLCRFADHLDTACALMGKFYSDDTAFAGRRIEELGWLKVTNDGLVYHREGLRKATPYQVSTLRELLYKSEPGSNYETELMEALERFES